MSDIPLPGGGTLKLWDSIYSPQQIEAAIGKGPMIQNGTWWLWDVATMKYWDTGYSLAEGLGPGAVTTPMLADGAVTTPKLADGSVTWPKLSQEARHSNPNLLDNAYFIGGGSQQGGGQFPINQRGLTEYIGQIYGIDRWYGYHDRCQVNIVADGLIVGRRIGGSSGVVVIYQKVENYKDYIGKQLTFSVLFKDCKATPRLNFFATNVTGDVKDEPQLVTTTVTIPEDAPVLLPGFGCDIADPGKTVTVLAAKLEEGPHQTLAYESAGGWILNDPPPNFADELMRCQRYQTDINGGRFRDISVGFAASKTRVYFTVCVPTTMRSSPAVTAEGLYAVRERVYSKLANFAVVGHGANAITISTYATEGEPFEAGGIYFLQARDTNNTLFFDANL